MDENNQSENIPDTDNENENESENDRTGKTTEAGDTPTSVPETGSSESITDSASDSAENADPAEANEESHPAEAPSQDVPALPASEEKTVYRWNYEEQAKHDRSGKGGHGLLTYAVIISVFFLAALGILVATLLITPEVPITPIENESMNYLYEYCNPSCVSVIAKHAEINFGYGSGFIVTEDGYIVTNYHVIEGSDSVSVMLYDKTEIPATVIATDDPDDIAVLKIETDTALTPVVIGTVEDMRPGDKVFAIGSPISSEFLGSFSSGYFSSLRTMESPQSGKIIPVIQTDTALNTGSSGGALFNMAGEVIGVTSYKKSPTGGYEGIGFAITIDSVIDVIEDMVENGASATVEKGALGIMGCTIVEGDEYVYANNLLYPINIEEETGRQFIVPDSMLNVFIYLDDKEMLEEFGITEMSIYKAPISAVYILEVYENFDADGKLLPGDIVTAVNGSPCVEITDLQQILWNVKAGDTVSMLILRDGAYKTVHVTLGKYADIPS